jgi:hypothetical protein
VGSRATPTTGAIQSARDWTTCLTQAVAVMSTVTACLPCASSAPSAPKRFNLCKTLQPAELVMSRRKASPHGERGFRVSVCASCFARKTANGVPSRWVVLRTLKLVCAACVGLPHPAAAGGR